MPNSSCWIPILLAAATLTSCRSLGSPVRSAVVNDPWLTLSYSPGFTGTPPWGVTIARDGRVFLQARQTYQQRRLSPTQLEALDAVMQKVRLDQLQSSYEFSGTDQETLRISFNGSYRASVRVYGPQRLCHRAEIQRFLHAWNAAIRLVVVPTTRHTHHIYEHCDET